MSQIEGFFVLDSENVVAADQLKVEKTTSDSSASAARKRLANISNLLQQPKHLTQDEKSRLSSATIKQYIEQLQKENTSLMKLLAEKNKIIELSGSELHKMRVNMQKMQQQNLQLAQSNSQMLAELNLGKDRLKGLQHELGCRNGLLIAKRLEIEEKAKMITCQKIDSKEKVYKCEETEVCTVADKDNDKHFRTSRRQKSKSLDPSTVKKVQDKDKAENKRLPARRQSARFGHDEPKPTEDFFEIDDVEPLICPLQEGDSNSLVLSVKKEDKREGDSSPDSKVQEHVRSSFSRPSRQAAKKIQSYKEVPLNVKMRRIE